MHLDYGWSRLLRGSLGLRNGGWRFTAEKSYVWSVHLKYKPSEREVRIQELKKQMKEKGKKYFPHYKVIPLFPIIKLYHAHKVFAYSDISIVARQSGFSARQWPQIVPFSNSISFLLLPWVYFWLNQAKSEACCLNIPLHFMSESQNSFKRSHLTQKKSTMTASALIMLCFYFHLQYIILSEI